MFPVREMINMVLPSNVKLYHVEQRLFMMTPIQLVFMHDQFHILEGAGDVAKNQWLT